MSNPLDKVCKSCHEQHETDFWCDSIKGYNYCLNCCPCAYGMAVPTAKKGVCKPVEFVSLEQPDTSIENDYDLPF